MATATATKAPEAKPKSDVNIRGITLKGVLSNPYTAGHKLTEAEANSLNYFRMSLIRNGFNNRVAKLQEAAGEAPVSEADIKKLHDDFVTAEAEFSFEDRRTRSTDPVRAIAMAKVTDSLIKQLRDKGTKRSDIDLSDVRKRAEEILNTRPDIMERAKKFYEESQALFGNIS